MNTILNQVLETNLKAASMIGNFFNEINLGFMNNQMFKQKIPLQKIVPIHGKVWTTISQYSFICPELETHLLPPNETDALIFLFEITSITS